MMLRSGCCAAAAAVAAEKLRLGIDHDVSRSVVPQRRRAGIPLCTHTLVPAPLPALPLIPVLRTLRWRAISPLVELD